MRVVLIDTAQVVPVARAASERWVPVRWTGGPDGLSHLGNLIVTSPAVACTEMNARVNRSGGLAAPPSTPSSAVLAGMMIALGVVAPEWTGRTT